MGCPTADHAQIVILAETCLQFSCISLYWSLFKTMAYPIADHAQILILAETVFNFHALAYTRTCLKVWDIRLQTMHKY